MPPKNRPKSLNKEEEESVLSFGYQKFLEDVKARVQTSQLRAAIQANSELIMLYWSIGEDIAKKQD